MERNVCKYAHDITKVRLVSVFAVDCFKWGFNLNKNQIVSIIVFIDEILFFNLFKWLWNLFWIKYGWRYSQLHLKWIYIPIRRWNFPVGSSLYSCCPMKPNEVMDTYSKNSTHTHQQKTTNQSLITIESIVIF